MDLVVAGLSHRTAPVHVRERVALAPEELPVQLARMLRDGFAEGLLLSTCNRLEVYGRVDRGSAGEIGARFLETLRPDLAAAVRDHLYVHAGDDAVRHLFRVASGLDSMVVGEHEIARQMSDAYGLACRTGTAGPLLHRAIPRALQIGKQVRTETALGRGAASVAGAAVVLAQRIFSDLPARRVLAIGAGETVETALKVLAPNRGNVVVLNRTVERARKLALAFGGQAGGLDEIPRRVAEAEVVVTATAAPEPLLRAAVVAQAMRRREMPLLVLDLGVPRDVDPAVREIDNVYLHDVDDLRSIADRALEQRAAEVPKAESIVASAVTEFGRRRRQMEAEPAIKALLDGLLRLRGDVLAEDASAPAESRAAAERATGRLVDKLVRRLAPRLKDGTVGPRELLDAFGIEPPGLPATPPDEDGHRRDARP